MVEVLFLKCECISRSFAACQWWASGPEMASLKDDGSYGGSKEGMCVDVTRARIGGGMERVETRRRPALLSFWRWDCFRMRSECRVASGVGGGGGLCCCCGWFCCAGGRGGWGGGGWGGEKGGGGWVRGFCW